MRRTVLIIPDSGPLISLWSAIRIIALQQKFFSRSQRASVGTPWFRNIVAETGHGIPTQATRKRESKKFENRVDTF